MTRDLADIAPPLLLPGEVAALFGVRSRTIAVWGARGELTVCRTPGGHRRYARDEVLALLARHQDAAGAS